MFQNQTQVGTALQVFYNLGLLVSTVNEVVRKVKEKLASCVQEALDHNTLSQAANSSAGGPGRAAMPTPGNTAAWRATLWTRMEQLMDSIFSACGQVNMHVHVYQDSVVFVHLVFHIFFGNAYHDMPVRNCR